MRQLANWFRHERLKRDLERELSYHIERRIGDLESSGLSAEEARRQAMLELGGMAQLRERVCDVWLTRWLRDLVYDLRFSLRSFFRTPVFTMTAVLSLMLGIGATTAIYSLVDQVLLHALPVREPGRLVLIDWNGDYVTNNAFGSWNLMSYPICRDLDEQKQFFEGVFCRALTRVNVSTGGDSYPTTAEIVSSNYFPVLGVGAALGQVITNDDDHVPNAVAVLSYDFWQMQLGGAADVIGRRVLVNRHSLTIIGVAARTFHGIDVGEVPVMWIPASMATAVVPDLSRLDDPRIRWMQVLGRLNEKMTLQRARAGLQPWFKAMLHQDMGLAGFPVISAERRERYLSSTLRLTAAPQGHSTLKRQLADPLWALFAVTAVLLGLACLNVSGLFLARASARGREIATRLALGASGGRLGRQLLADSMLIAGVGGILGICAAPVAVRSLIAFLSKRSAANALHAGLDSRVLLFALAATAGAGILSGLAPAWQAARRSLGSSLRSRGGASFGTVRLRKMIVTAQIALALTLVAGAALFVRTLDALMAKGPGFATSGLVSFGIDGQRGGYSTAEGEKLIERIGDAIAHSPVTEESAIARFPLLTGGSWNDPMTIFADRRIATDRDVDLNAVTPEFFRTMGIKLLAGRNFDERDVSTRDNRGWRSAIVNEAFVKRYLGERNPLGLKIGEGSGPNAKPTAEIVGVMSDFSYRGLREQSEQVYFPFYEGEHPYGTFYARVRGAPEGSFKVFRDIVHSADPTLPMIGFRTLDEQVDQSLNTERMLATLSSSFSTLALLLSLVGLYGVMSFVVTQRMREIAIRMALGASRRSAIWLMLRDALVMILAGIAMGLPFVWAFGRLVESQLYEVKPWDPLVTAVAVLALCSAGIGATLVPARRAAAVNPMEALRLE